MSSIVTDAGRHLPVPDGFVDEAEQCLSAAGQDLCLAILRPGEYPALTAVAAHLLQENFLEKDGVPPDSFYRHLAALEPQVFTVMLKPGPKGPIPVGAAQVAIHERHPPDSIRDIDTVFGMDIPRLCANTTMPSGRTMPNLLTNFRDVAGFEAIAVWPEYRASRAAPYALLLYAQVTRYLVARRNINMVTAILDMRPGAVFSQLQSCMRSAFNLYGLPIRPRVYWTGGRWVELSDKEVSVGADGQPLVEVPNYSAPAYLDLWTWLDRLRSGDAKDRLCYDRVVGDALVKKVAFDPSFELEPLMAG
jgi:hypothetical protein